VVARATALAWAVHLYTASGAVLCALALFAIFEGDYRRAWLLLFFTVVIDVTDGFLARTARVGAVLPGFDGRRLDDIVDYLAWVFVPVVLLVRAELLPAWAAAAPILASAYGFGQAEAKTEDHYFLGFPSYWSIVGFYLFEFDAPPAIGTAIILLFSLLVFVPIRYPYPTRTRALRTLTLALGAPWGPLGLALVLVLPDKPRPLILLSLYYPAYYAALTVALWWRRARSAG
jgi:phosphatidylcholine synthase